MIQFNLLPDIKLEYIKTRRVKRLVMLIAGLVTAASVLFMILLFIIVNGFQKNHLRNLSETIASDSQTIKDTPDLEKILTIQSQLISLPELHNKKPVASRLADYIKQVTPTQVSIARLDVNYTDSTFVITGATDSLGTVNKFIDTLKFTEYKDGDTTERAFYDVVMSAFGRDSKGASFTVNLKYKPAIFESSSEVSLNVPNLITTRSQTEKPSALFQPLSNPDNTTGGPQ